MASSSPRKMGVVELGLYSLVLPNVWSFAATALAIGVYAGGVPTLLYGTLIWGAITSLQCLSFAEYASAYPSSSGCVLIATRLGGDRYGRICGYMTGCLHFFAGLVTPAALLSAVTSVMLSIGTVVNPKYEPQRWHQFVAYQICNIVCNALSVSASRWLDRVAIIGGISLFIIFFASVGLIVNGAQETATNQVVWSEVVNVTGFKTGFAILIGASLPLSGFGPVHWMLNMADETKNPRRVLPIALLIQQMGNIAMLFSFFVAIGYGVGGNWDTVINSYVSTPIGAIYNATIPTVGGTVALMVCITLFSVLSNGSYINATVRLMHGFAITGAVPYSRWLSRYDHNLNGPTNMAYLVTVVTALLGTLIFASSAVLNTLVGAAMSLYFVGYIPVFVAHILTSGRNLGEHGYFRLPRSISVVLAYVNVAAGVLQAISFSLPPESPVTVTNMNWAPLVIGVCILSLVPSWMLYGKSRYNMDIEPFSGDIVIQGEDDATSHDCELSSAKFKN